MSNVIAGSPSFSPRSSSSADRARRSSRRVGSGDRHAAQHQDASQCPRITDASSRRERSIAELEASVAIRCPDELGGHGRQERGQLGGVAGWLCGDRLLECIDELPVRATDPGEEPAIHREDRCRFPVRVVERTGGLVRAHERDATARLARCELGPAQREQEVALFRCRDLRANESGPFDGGQAAAADGHCIFEGETIESNVRGIERVVRSLVRVCVGVVVRQLREVLVEIGDMKPLDRVRDATVQTHPPAHAEPVVERAAHDCVSKREPVGTCLVDQARGSCFLQGIQHRVGIEVGQLVEQPDLELASHHRSQCQHVLSVVRQARDTSQHDVSRGRWDPCVPGPEIPCRNDPVVDHARIEVARFRKAAHDLVDEERVPCSLRVHRLGKAIARLTQVVARRRLDERGDIRCPQTTELETIQRRGRCTDVNVRQHLGQRMRPIELGLTVRA